VDFGQGDMIDLELRVRGYLVTVLTDCRLTAGQRWEDEPLDSDFEIRVRAQVPATGQLLRWLLGAGNNVEVVAPPDLRRVVAVQAAKMAALYADADGE
jgi:proteasome accessory factor B